MLQSANECKQQELHGSTQQHVVSRFVVVEVQSRAFGVVKSN